MARVNRDAPSEYGGRPGIIQQASDGHSLETSEAAMVLRSRGKRDAMVSNETGTGHGYPVGDVGSEWSDALVAGERLA